MIILLSARHSSREQKAQEVMLFPCPANPGLLFIVTALSPPCAVTLNGAGGFSTSFSRKSTPQEISDIRSEASMSESILALLAELRLLPSRCPSRTAGPQGARPNSVWGHMKGRVLCQSRVSPPLQAEQSTGLKEQHVIYPSSCSQHKIRTDSTSVSKTDFGDGGILATCQCDMKVMGGIPEFAPGPWCQTSLPDNKVQLLISLESSQRWGLASRVRERKTNPSLNAQEQPGARRADKRQDCADLLSSCQPWSALCPRHGQVLHLLGREGGHRL